MSKKRARSDSRGLRQPAGLPKGTRVLELTYLGRNPFGFRLAPALNTARTAGRLSAATDADVRERLIWLRTKYDALSVVATRFRQGWEALREQALKSDPAHDAYTLSVGRTEAVTLAVDVEAVITLLHATLDSVVALATVIEREVLEPQGRRPEKILRALPGISDDEQELFRLARHGFAHSQAPWLAVVLPPNAPPDLAILTRLRPDYEGGEGYLLLSQLERWWVALRQHLETLEGSLAALLGRD